MNQTNPIAPAVDQLLIDIKNLNSWYDLYKSMIKFAEYCDQLENQPPASFLKFCDLDLLRDLCKMYWTEVQHRSSTQHMNDLCRRLNELNKADPSSPDFEPIKECDPPTDVLKLIWTTSDKNFKLDKFWNQSTEINHKRQSSLQLAFVNLINAFESSNNLKSCLFWRDVPPMTIDELKLQG